MTALDVRNLAVMSPGGVIVSHVDLAVLAGQTVAMVGESGSGKSMTAKAITGLLPRGLAATGTLRLDDSSVQLADGPTALDLFRGRRISLLLQNPFTSLSPVHRCGQQIAAALAPERRRDDTEVVRRLDEVELPARVARQYPFELSGGMRQRVALAAALASDPVVLIGDEPTTALDVTTQREVLDLLARIQRERAMALLLITHDLGVARERADRIVVMYAGRVVEEGPGTDVFLSPLHPYSAALRDCDPPLRHRLQRLPAIPGSVPRAADIVAGCVFADRCERADHTCRTETPALAGPDRRVACFKPLEATAVSTTELSTVVPVQVARYEPLLVVSSLTKRFGAGQPLALDGVSIEVGVGEAVGIVGESGSGKTTLARCLVGLERADDGTVDTPTAGAPAARAQVVFQDPTSALNPRMTVGRALAEALRAGGRDASEVPDLLSMVGLPVEYARRRPAALSGGEQQRVAIARAVAPRPALLICDEPVSSLDVSVQAQILNLMNDLVERLGLAMLFITHDLAVVRQVVTRVYVMHHGRVVEEGSMDRMVKHPQHDYTRQLFASVPAS
ncbi:MAG: oligopeptide/dipeptide ABC transporter ATP-binding protein [Ilumatobacteraceae bacterium]